MAGGLPPVQRGTRITRDLLNKLHAGRPPEIRGGPGVLVHRSGDRRTIERVGRLPLGKQTFQGLIMDFTDQTNNRWTYEIHEAIKDSPGYGGWAVRMKPIDPDDPEGPMEPARIIPIAYHYREEMNDGAGIEGNGVDVDQLETVAPNMEYQPVPIGQLVEVDIVRLSDGTNTEFWFRDLNAIDGTC